MLEKRIDPKWGVDPSSKGKDTWKHVAWIPNKGMLVADTQEELSEMLKIELEQQYE